MVERCDTLAVSDADYDKKPDSYGQSYTDKGKHARRRLLKVTFDEGQAGDVAAYPTENAIKNKEHRKQLKEKGLTPKRKKRIVEDHHDDLGDDLSLSLIHI